MPYVDWFSGSRPMKERCKKLYWWTLYPSVFARSDAGTAKVGGASFRVDVDGVQADTCVADAGEECFTLVFDDDPAGYELTVTHEESGFTGKCKGSNFVELSKPWDLHVVVEEKWPKDEALGPFEGAKIEIAGQSKTADKNGEVKAVGQAAGSACTVKLDIAGIDKTRCTMKVETVEASTPDGFLARVDKTVKETQGASEITVTGGPDARVTVTIVVEVSVIAPKLEADPVALVHRVFTCGTTSHETTLSELGLSLEKTHEVDVDGLLVELVFGSEIACFTDADAGNEHKNATWVAAKDLPPKLHVKGLKAGTCQLTMGLDTKKARGERTWRIRKDKGKRTWRMDDKAAEGEILVEPLEIVVWKHLEAKDGDTKATSDPKTRELHNQKNEIFTVARLAVKKPSGEFWKRATELTLSAAGGSAALFADAKCTTALKPLVEKSFTKDPLEIWAKGTGSTTLDKQDPHKPKKDVYREKGVTKKGKVQQDNAWNAYLKSYWGTWKAWDKAKVVTPCCVSAGAKVGSKALAHGDHVRLDTYSLDVYLDRVVHNKCGVMVKPNHQAHTVTKVNVAVARAAGHKYLELESGFHHNKNLAQTGVGSLFDQFIDAVKPKTLNEDTGARAARGLKVVFDHLDDAGFTLHATAQAMIKEHIKRTLDSPDPNHLTYMKNRVTTDCYGFDVTRGVPGVHAEVLAVNEVLNELENRNDPIDSKEVTVATYRLQDSSQGQGKRFVACTNCHGILCEGTHKVRVVTEVTVFEP